MMPRTVHDAPTAEAQLPMPQNVWDVPVVTRSLVRSVGEVEIRTRYVEVELANELVREKLATEIRLLGDIDLWSTAKGTDRKGVVEIDCEASTATNVLVSVVCRVRDATIAKVYAPVPTRPTRVRAAVFAIDGSKLHRLGLANQLRTDIPVRQVVVMATNGSTADVRKAWREGECSRSEPHFAITPMGMTLWPDELTPACSPCHLESSMVVNLILSRSILVSILTRYDQYS